ncbi:unnamed protein product [Urochloa humidicola]
MDSVVERGIEVCRCLVLPPNFSIYEEVLSHRHNLQRPSKSTWSATGAVTIAGRLDTHWHPQPVPTEIPFTGATPTEPPGRILQGQLARRRRPRLERFGEAYVYADPRWSKPCVCQENLLRCAAN